ncbi:MAG: tyrosine-type recombinase/integrase [Candidatus Acidiferrales bacterium]
MFPVLKAQPQALATVAVSAPPLDPSSERQALVSELLAYFLAYARVEQRLSLATVEKYKDSLVCILRIIGDMPPQEISQQHVLMIKAKCLERNLSPARVSSLMYALKSFLKFCRLNVGLATMDLKQIHAPRIPKREVLFLTADEVQEFVAAIPIRKSSRTFDMRWLCFRALVEVLLGTGMRISEGLSLKRSSINLETGEAVIIGKGNKERTVFFSPRALNWVKEYVTRRTDRSDALFVVCKGKPLNRATAITWFRRFQKVSGIKKRVTAHILRHTVATTLLFNGCPIGHIREILGHEHLLTTCKFYLGTDKRAAKNAHAQYLNYESGPASQS